MPEIWLGYGDSNVILDIKYENILDINKTDFSLLGSEALFIELDKEIKLYDSCLILNFNPFTQMIPLLKIINEKSKINGINDLEIYTLSTNIPLKIKRELNDNGITIRKIESSDILNKIK